MLKSEIGERLKKSGREAEKGGIKEKKRNEKAGRKQ